mgnify:CR=1 FL=1
MDYYVDDSNCSNDGNGDNDNDDDYDDSDGVDHGNSTAKLVIVF